MISASQDNGGAKVVGIEKAGFKLPSISLEAKTGTVVVHKRQDLDNSKGGSQLPNGKEVDMNGAGPTNQANLASEDPKQNKE